MELQLQRLISNSNETVGKLMFGTNHLCYTLEDEKREVKVKGETRIPSGRYEIKYRKIGGHHATYKKKFPKSHQGMMWLQNVPGFEYILIHIGNYDKDTDGCILVGKNYSKDANGKYMITNSTQAYTEVYKIISGAMERGESVFITITDEPTVS